MGSRHELYNCLIGRLNSLVEVSHLKHLTNWTWIVVGILQANSIALSQIANHIPSEAEAESRVTPLRRWLKNLKIDVWALYRPVLEQVLAGWHAVEATLMLEGVAVFGDRLPIFRLSLVHGHRAIPLV